MLRPQRFLLAIWEWAVAIAGVAPAAAVRAHDERMPKKTPQKGALR